MAEGKEKNKFFAGTGRRKTAVARVFLYDSKGEFTVNGQKIDDYFAPNIEKSKWEKPFHAIGVSHPEAKYSATIKVSGSGKSSQMDAVVLGISRALSKIDNEFEEILGKQGFLTRDPRMVERKKPFLHKARKKPQYSKR
jgi:small subunit ribosomal protein S9